MILRRPFYSDILVATAYCLLLSPASARLPSIHESSKQHSCSGCYVCESNSTVPFDSGGAAVSHPSGERLTVETCLELCGGSEHQYAGLTAMYDGTSPYMNLDQKQN